MTKQQVKKHRENIWECYMQNADDLIGKNNEKSEKLNERTLTEPQKEFQIEDIGYIRNILKGMEDSYRKGELSSEAKDAYILLNQIKTNLEDEAYKEGIEVRELWK